MNSLFLTGLYEHHNHAFGHNAFPLCVKVENTILEHLVFGPRER